MISKRQKKWWIFLSVIITIVIVLIVLWPGTPGAPDSVKCVADLEVYLQKITDFGNPPGMSLVVVKDDSIIYSKSFGWADRPRKIGATPETVYHWFSITKIVTAISILQLQEQDMLELDDSVTKFLPFFNVQYPSVTSKAITIRNLLNHSSGLREHLLRLMRWIHYEGDPHVNQTELVIKELPAFSKLKFEPGDHSAYTNFGYMVLGAIIEKISNQTYEDYVRQNILEPLGMKHTDFIYTKEMDSLEATGSHLIFNGRTIIVPFVKGSIIRETFGKYFWFRRFYNDQTPPTGLIGSATDAAHLVIAYLNKGEFEGRRILSEQSVTIMTNESHIGTKKKYDDSVKRGIGWLINKRDSLKLEHTGGGLGFSTMMQLHPDKKLGFILFTNGTINQAPKIFDLAIGIDWSTPLSSDI